MRIPLIRSLPKRDEINMTRTGFNATISEPWLAGTRFYSIEKEKTVGKNSSAAQDQQLKKLFFVDAQGGLVFHQHQWDHEDKCKQITEGCPRKRLKYLRCHSGGNESASPHDRYKNQLDINHCAKVGLLKRQLTINHGFHYPI